MARQLFIADEPARGLCTEADIDARIHENMFWSEVAEEYRPPMRRKDGWLVLAMIVGSWASVIYLVRVGAAVLGAAA